MEVQDQKKIDDFEIWHEIQLKISLIKKPICTNRMWYGSGSDISIELMKSIFQFSNKKIKAKNQTVQTERLTTSYSSLKWKLCSILLVRALFLLLFLNPNWKSCKISSLARTPSELLRNRKHRYLCEKIIGNLFKIVLIA
jgi:hypothetical protein